MKPQTLFGYYNLPTRKKKKVLLNFKAFLLKIVFSVATAQNKEHQITLYNILDISSKGHL